MNNFQAIYDAKRRHGEVSFGRGWKDCPIIKNPTADKGTI